MFLVRLLIAAAYTIAIFVTEDLEVKAFTVHFEAFGLFAVASHLLYFLYFEHFLSFFSFFVNVHSPKSRYGTFILRWYKCVIVRNCYWMVVGIDVELVMVFM